MRNNGISPCNRYCFYPAGEELTLHAGTTLYIYVTTNRAFFTKMYIEEWPGRFFLDFLEHGFCKTKLVRLKNRHPCRSELLIGKKNYV
jgi:hypothetical protein